MVSLNISSPVFNAMNFHSKAPDEFAGRLLRDSKVSYTNGKFGKILLQEVEVNGITILYNIFRIDEDVPITFSWKPGMIQVHAALESRSHYNIDGIRYGHLEEGEFNIVDASFIRGTQYLKRGNQYQSLHIVYSREFIDQLLPLFPALEVWMAADKPRPGVLYKNNMLLTPDLREVTRSILNCTRFNCFHSHYLEIIAKEFLLLSMIPVHQQIIPSNGLSRQQLQIIHESRRMIDTDYNQLSSIADIAKELSVGELKLKAGFKKLFGMSMYDYLVQTRMETAQKLLSETNKPIKEVASLSGYSSKQSFSKAFKKYFNATPGAIR